MFETAYTDTTDHLFDNPAVALSQLRASPFVHQESVSLDSFSRRHQRILVLTDHYRRQNEQLRKPCPICRTLVKPHLQQQHNDAYHA